MTPGLILGTRFGEVSSVFLVDREGHVQWTHLVQGGLTTANAMVGGETLFYDTVMPGAGIGHIQQLSLASADLDLIDTPELHHSFTRLPDATVAWLEIDVRDTAQWGPVVGDRIVERSPDGTERTITSLWDHLPVTTHEFFDDPFYPQGKDWTHSNGLTYDPTTDHYVVTSRNLGAIVEIDRGTGDMVRYVDASSLADEPGTLHVPHAARWTTDATLLVVSSSPRGDATWASELAIRPDGRADEVWSHGRDDVLFAQAKGEARRLDTGNTLINWGSAGTIREVAPDGTVVWEATVRDGAFLGTTAIVPADSVASLTRR